MAKFNITNNAESFTWWPNLFENSGTGSITKFTSNSIVFHGTDAIITIGGSGFSKSGNTATGGNVSSITVRDSTGKKVLLTITDLKIGLGPLYSTLFGWDDGDGHSKNPSGWEALNLLLYGKDKLTGSNKSDNLGGYSHGNDVVDGRGGDDNVFGDYGRDKLNGGSGWDELNYSETFFGLPSTRGFKLDAAKKKVVDPWGFVDKIKSFESFRGSANSDVMKGSGKDEIFKGLLGNDQINGRGGRDGVDYEQDVEYGGGLGVNVNLKTGKARDGWGNTDRLKNIEEVTGTRFADVLVGNKKNNTLKGQDGNDTLTGDKGADTFVFNNPPNSSTNHDTIKDFNPGQGDRIALNKPDAFPALSGDGGLSANQFVANASGNATTAQQRIIYNTSTGDLFYDPTGNSVAGDKVLFATLTTKPTIDHTAFEIWT